MFPYLQKASVVDAKGQDVKLNPLTNQQLRLSLVAPRNPLNTLEAI